MLNYNMQKTILFDSKYDNFPPLSFWKKLPTKSEVYFENETNKEIFSHVASDTVYFFTDDNCVLQKFHYDMETTELNEDYDCGFPVKIIFSKNKILNYVLIPVKFFNDIINDFKSGEIKLYEDYMDQGWGEVEIENADYIYIENGDDTLSYINGEGLWILYEDMLSYDPQYDESAIYFSSL